MTAAFAGFTLGLSLILAIGAQNAFVLKQGLMRQHILAVVLTCAVSDALLIVTGVSSFRIVEKLFPAVDEVFIFAGAIFLVWYGWQHLSSAWRGGAHLDPDAQGAGSLRAAVMTCLALTWLNPHVYLDTVILLGSLSTNYPGGRVAFGAGAVAASFVFFFALGYGARALTPLFASSRAWRVLDLVVGITMWWIAASLVLP